MDGQRDDDFDALLEKSSLGGPAARQLRERTSAGHARTVRRISELRNLLTHHEGARDETAQAAREIHLLLASLGYRASNEIPPESRAPALPGQGGSTLAAKVRTLTPSMTRSMQRVAEAIASDPAGCAALTITGLAERAGTSEPTVVRTARLLGYLGYHDLRLALTELATQQQPGHSAARTDVPGDRAGLSPVSEVQSHHPLA